MSQSGLAGSSQEVQQMKQSITIDIAAKEITNYRPHRKGHGFYQPRKNLHLETCTKRGNQLTMMIGYGKDLKGKGINTYHRSFNKTQTTTWKENPKYMMKLWYTPRRYFRKRTKVNYEKKEPKPRTVRKRFK